MARIYLHDAEYEEDDLTLGRYLETLQRPEGVTDQQFQQLRRKSRTFLVRDGYLFKRSRKRGIPLEELLANRSSDLRFLMSYTTKLGIVDSKGSMINCTGGINGRTCTTMSSNTSNRALNVNVDLEYDRRSLCILHGV